MRNMARQRIMPVPRSNDFLRGDQPAFTGERPACFHPGEEHLLLRPSFPLRELAPVNHQQLLRIGTLSGGF